MQMAVTVFIFHCLHFYFIAQNNFHEKNSIFFLTIFQTEDFYGKKLVPLLKTRNGTTNNPLRQNKENKNYATNQFVLIFNLITTHLQFVHCKISKNLPNFPIFHCLWPKRTNKCWSIKRFSIFYYSCDVLVYFLKVKWRRSYDENFLLISYTMCVQLFSVR